MFSFKTKKRKEKERLAKIEADRKAEEEKAEEARLERGFEIIKNQIDQYRSDLNKWSRENADKKNNTCPNCGATGVAVVNRIKDIEGSGKISGHLSGYNNTFFGTGGGSIRGSINGSSEIHTDPVRHCTKCTNEWKAEKSSYHGSSEYLEHFVHRMIWIVQEPEKFGSFLYDKQSSLLSVMTPELAAYVFKQVGYFDREPTVEEIIASGVCKKKKEK